MGVMEEFRQAIESEPSICKDNDHRLYPKNNIFQGDNEPPIASMECPKVFIATEHYLEKYP